MKVFLKGISWDATGDFDVKNNHLIVKKGTKVSTDISVSKTFKSSETIKAQREKYVCDGVVMEDVEFSSPSTAANFVTGRSTNGKLAWRDEENRSISKIVKAVS